MPRRIVSTARSSIATLALFALLSLQSMENRAWAQTREEIVRGDKEKVEREGFWMYNDLPGAFEKARETGKPIIVVLRCLPCHECVKLDDELVDTDPVIRPLLEQFICVRQVATNGLDLDLFQYDTDQSFAVFFLNADKTVYGRFGTRSHRTEWMGDVSLKGLAKALEGALELHRNFDNVKASLAGKRGKPMEVSSPELYPALQDKFTDSLDYEGDVVKSCIHCHQIGDAQRTYYWHAGKPIPESVLWPYPHPKMLGLTLDPNETAVVKAVDPSSVASETGLIPDDVIDSFDNQPILSIADVQWVLHNVSPDGGEVPMTVNRDGRDLNLTLKLAKGWRRKGDLSWRVTTWGLRRIAGGGMVLESDPSSGELVVKRVGKYGPHGTARRVGVREGDVIVSYDGRSDFSTEQDVLTYVVRKKKAGDNVRIDLRRGGKEIQVQLPIQK